VTRRRALLGAAALILCGAGLHAEEQDAAPYGAPEDDQRVFAHAVLDEFEFRAGAQDFGRWEGEAWAGTDSNRVWIKSEGELDAGGQARNAQHELLYDRPISAYFDLQAGARVDGDSAPERTWAALGVEGLAPYFIHLTTTIYADTDGGGRYAAKGRAYTDLAVTQRLILQPQLELNGYSKPDPARELGSGLSELDAGLRLRYEIIRKFAPYLGVTYQREFAGTALAYRRAGVSATQLSVVIGLRLWL
jgi:copper resistance protein B